MASNPWRPRGRGVPFQKQAAVTVGQVMTPNPFAVHASATFAVCPPQPFPPLPGPRGHATAGSKSQSLTQQTQSAETKAK